jgi:hypothetical protein
VESLLIEALRRVNEDVRSEELDQIHPDMNVYAAIDSMAIVDLLLETESRLELATGRYIALADETTFDASKSPLLRWRDWVAYVERRHGE